MSKIKNKIYMKRINKSFYYFSDALVDFIYIFLLFLFGIFSIKWSIGSSMDFLGLIIPASEKQFLINNIIMEIFGISFVILFSVLFFLIFCLEVEEPRYYKIIPFKYSEEEENFLDALFILIPSFLIYCMLLPTLGFLFKFDLVDTSHFPGYLFEIGVTGHQWYWEYHYYLDTFIPIIVPSINEIDMPNNNLTFSFDSNYVLHNVYNKLYCLGVDKPMVVPIGYPIMISVTGNDVIHSFYVPALGIKLDGIPGKLATEILYNNYELTLFGQCAELCGYHHGWMPIQIEWIPLDQWCCWVALNIDYLA